MFIQTRNRAIKMSKGTHTPSFDDFCKGLINEQDKLIPSGQLCNNKALVARSKRNPNKNFKNSKPHNQGSSSIDDASNFPNMVSEVRSQVEFL